MDKNTLFLPEIYTRFILSQESHRANFDVFQQKIKGSDDFVCVHHEESAVGQHLIDFLSLTNAKLPALIAELKSHFSFVQTHNFDHQLVPVYLENAIKVYIRITQIHPIWAAALSHSSLLADFGNYTFYSVRPSPYLIETYDEVDRLMDEELYWTSICNQLQENLKWLEYYQTVLRSFENVLLFCLDGSQPAELTGLTNLQRAFIYQSYFDRHFLDQVHLDLMLTLQERYVSPLGKTLSRVQLERPIPRREADSDMNDTFQDVVVDKRGPIQIGQMVDLFSRKSTELCATMVIQGAADIYALCSCFLYLLIMRNVKIRRCKNCNQYFVPLNRSDEMYCCRIQKNGKMCRELDYATKINDDDLLRIYRTAYKTHNARKQRNLKNRTTSEEDFKKWTLYAKELLEQAKTGQISAQEFQSMLRE